MMTSELLSQYTLKKYRRRKIFSAMMCILLGISSLIALIPLLSVFGYVLSHGIPGLHLQFFTELPRPVGDIGGGMANSILGTLTLILIASIIGVPWGIGTGLYLSEYGRGRFSDFVRFSADMLGSIPSIIVGLFVYSMVVVPMKRFSVLAGGIALGILMVPTLARSVEEILKTVPIHLREAGLALGLPRWKVIIRIILLGNSKAITTGIMLAVARVSGETAPLLFTSLNNQFWQKGLDQPISALPVQIFSYAISPYQEWHQLAWTGALVLVLIVVMMNLLTRYFLGSIGSKK